MVSPGDYDHHWSRLQCAREETFWFEVDRVEKYLNEGLVEKFKTRHFGPPALRGGLQLGYKALLSGYFQRATGLPIEVVAVQSGYISVRGSVCLIPELWKHVYAMVTQDKEWSSSWKCAMHVVAQESEFDLIELSKKLDARVVYAHVKSGQVVVGYIGPPIGRREGFTMECMRHGRVCGPHCEILDASSCSYPCVKI